MNPGKEQPDPKTPDAVGKETKAAVIVKRLKNASDWLKVNGHHATEAHKEIKIACVLLLRQSPADYGSWIRRNGTGLNLVRLVELTISDVEAAPYDYQMPWQLDQFAGGAEVRAARRSLESKCKRCGRTFRPKRRSAEYCGQTCRKAAQRSRERHANGLILEKTA